MNKTLKALVLAFLGLIIWTGLVYITFAFLKAEVNPLYLETKNSQNNNLKI